MIAMCAMIAACLMSLPAPNKDDSVGRPVDRSGEQRRSGAASGLITGRIAHRTLKTFDFDEASQGNHESMPIGWRRVEGPGQPRYADARFDAGTGRTSGPSFRLDLAGGGVAAEYTGRAIDVHPQCDYEVSAYIRTSELPYAGASIAVFYLDHALTEIAGSRRVGPRVKVTNDGWARVSVRLTGGHEDARWLGLACCVDPDQTPTDSDHRLRPLVRQSVSGTAWFDDIEVTRLPRTVLETVEPAAVFRDGEPAKFRVGVGDLDAGDLSATFHVLDSGGTEVFQRELPIAGVRAQGDVLELSPPGPGRYTASVRIMASGRMLLERSVAFAYVGSAAARTGSDQEPRQFDAAQRRPSLPGDAATARGIGLILDLPVDATMAATLQMVDSIGPAAVKLPLWRRDLSDEAVLRGDRLALKIVDALHQRGIMIVGSLDDVPMGLAARYDALRVGLLEVLRGPANVWRPYLALTVTRFGSRVGMWQIGCDDSAGEYEYGALSDAAIAVRREFGSLLGDGRLAVPVTMGQFEPGEIRPMEAVSFQARRDVSARSQFLSDRPSMVPGDTKSNETNATKWLTVRLASEELVDRHIALAEFAQSLVLGRIWGAPIVFVPQPWRTGADPESPLMEPTAAFPVIHALGRALSGLEPIEALKLGDGVEGWLFGDAGGDRSAVVLWRDGSSERDSRGDLAKLTLDIGAGARYRDAAGQLLPLGQSLQGRTLAVSEMPSVLTDVSMTRMLALSGFELSPSRVVPGPRKQMARLRFRNPRNTGFHGELHLEAPTGWEISPSVVRMDLAPGQRLDAPISLRVPSNQPSGPVEIIARLASAGHELDGLSLRAAAQVGCEEIDVNVLARREGRVVRVFHRVTNRSSAVLNLRSVMIAPDRPESGRIIRALGPGQTAIREYEIPDSVAHSGRPIRVSVEQVDGPIRDNRLINLAPPTPEGEPPVDRSSLVRGR